MTKRQRQVLTILAASPKLPFRDIKARFDNPPPDRTLREDLIQLKKLGLLRTEGRGRGAVWVFRPDHDE